MSKSIVSAEDYLRDKYKLVDFAGLTINGVKWTDLMEEYASQFKESQPTRLKEEDVEKMEGKLIESLNKWIVGCENMGYDIDFIETRLVNICSDHQLNLSR